MLAIQMAIVIGLCVICFLNMQFWDMPVQLLLRVQPEEIEFPFVEEDMGVLFILDSNEEDNASIEITEAIVAPRAWTSDMLLPSVDTDRLPGHRLPLLPALPSDNWQFAPLELKGQVTLQTTFGQELYRLSQKEDVHLVLEIGTWFGGGSSWCIAQGLRRTIRDHNAPDKWLITMELFEPAWEYASKTLALLPVTCMKATTVEVEGYLKPEQMSAEDRSSEHYKLYYERDLKLAGEDTPLLEQLCSTYDFDFVLIDGNEYTGLAEYEIVDQVCRPLYLALHDTNTLKTRRVEELLAQGSDRWSKISSGVDAAGWAVYKSVLRV